jgi:predicted AAA+ superfamily ATPase
VASYYPRLVDPVLERLLHAAPAVLVVGPRAAGKTTAALQQVGNVVHLDREADAAAFRADPDAALRRYKEPLLLDEWQAAPEVLGALKRSIDADPRPGRFLLTGSVRADLTAETWPGTGRLIRVSVWPMTQRELLARAARGSFIDSVMANGVAAVNDPAEPLDLPAYLELCEAGGYPQPVLTMDPETRLAWYDSYLDQLVTRDATNIAGARDPARLRRYVDVLAECTAGLPSNETLLSASGVNAKTAAAYESLLSALGMLEIAQAWTSNRVKRLMLRGKRYLTDTGIVAAALNIDADDMLRDGDLYGRILDTFVAAQVRPELATHARPPKLHHVRDKDCRHEIDQLVDAGRRGVLAIEVKATAAPRPADAAHLVWLRDRIGSAFRAGLVFHTGPRAFVLSDRIAAVPIASLWS